MDFIYNTLENNLLQREPIRKPVVTNVEYKEIQFIDVFSMCFISTITRPNIENVMPFKKIIVFKKNKFLNLSIKLQMPPDLST